MLRLVSLLCLAVAVFGTPLQGVPQQNGRIVGGDPVDDIAKYNYQLSLTNGGFFECGAVIISQLWAVTAAQCAGGSIANMVLRAGSTQWDDETDGKTYEVVQKVVHLSYNPSTSDYDIALLKVKDGFEFGTTDPKPIGPIALPAAGAELAAGTDCEVLGWGSTSAGGTWSKDLLVADVLIVANNVCVTNYNGFGTVTLRMLCASSPGKDACQGDSGGPLVSNIAGVDTLVGIVSWGRGCALAAFPGVYTNVASLRNWILANTGV